MLSNRAIADHFDQLASIMELHDENPFKVKSYQNAYLTLKKLPTPIAEMPPASLESIKGIGKAISEKIQELLREGNTKTFQQFAEKTPEGIVQMLAIRGLGAKKIRVIWQELGIESIGELEYACHENRLITLKGFGEKTQLAVLENLQAFQQHQGKHLYAHLEEEANRYLIFFTEKLPNATIDFTGAWRRRCPVVEKIDFIIAADEAIDEILDKNIFPNISIQKNEIQLITNNNIKLCVFHCKKSEFGSKQFLHSATKEFLEDFLQKAKEKDFKNQANESDVFAKAGLPFIVPERRESTYSAIPSSEQLLKNEDICGVIHTHTTYSDGVNTLEEMSQMAQQLAYQYMVISDHSKSSFYANGLSEQRLLEQMSAIDSLNSKNPNFKLYKSVECDIHFNGNLDYDDEILKQLDVVIASVHSILKMDIDKATARLIKAIENPYTRILGHPTGRLLLARNGYPIDYQKVIDACAANNVAIELNANPRRLDLDWTHLHLAIEKNVLISINPDAHSKAGICDIKYGVFAARKAGVCPLHCLNTKTQREFEEWLASKR